MKKLFSWLFGQQGQTLEALILDIAQALRNEGEVDAWFASLEVLDEVFPLLRQFVPDLDVVFIRPFGGQIIVSLRNADPAWVCVSILFIGFTGEE